MIIFESEIPSKSLDGYMCRLALKLIQKHPLVVFVPGPREGNK